MPAALLEVWVWSADPLAVTFGGQLPRGSREWQAAVWLAIAAEAARCGQSCPEHGGLKYGCGCP